MLLCCQRSIHHETVHVVVAVGQGHCAVRRRRRRERIHGHEKKNKPCETSDIWHHRHVQHSPSWRSSRLSRHLRRRRVTWSGECRKISEWHRLAALLKCDGRCRSMSVASVFVSMPAMMMVMVVVIASFCYTAPPCTYRRPIAFCRQKIKGVAGDGPAIRIITRAPVPRGALLFENAAPTRLGAKASQRTVVDGASVRDPRQTKQGMEAAGQGIELCCKGRVIGEGGRHRVGCSHFNVVCCRGNVCCFW